MKKVVCLIAVLALTASVAVADPITITAQGNVPSNGYITIGYSGATGAKPVGFSFIVDCGAGGNVAAAGDINKGDSFFDVFIDFASDDPAAYQAGADPLTGIWAAANPLAKTDAAGAVTLPAVQFAVSAAELANVAAIPTSGTICVLKLTKVGAAASTIVTFAEDTLRGGVVDVNGVAMTVTLPAATTVNFVEPPCFVGQPQEAYWVSLGSPDCWCYPRQCHGDADDFGQGKTPYQPVASSDLDVLKAAYGKTTAQLLADPMITVGGHTVAKACADFTRSIHGKAPNQQPVAGPDLDILKSYYGKATSAVPGNCPTTTVKRAPWTNLP